MAEQDGWPTEFGGKAPDEIGGVTSASAWTARTVNVPRSRLATVRTASVRSPVLPYAAATRCATTSVSVSERNVTPSAPSSVLSSVKFSTMPLWMTATRPSGSS